MSNFLVFLLTDTSGQDKFKTITKAYYRGAHAMLIIADLTDKNCLKSIKKCMREVNENKDLKQMKVLIGTKSDLSDMICVTDDEIRTFCDKYDMRFYKTFSKTSEGVTEAFTEISKELFNKSKCILTNENTINKNDNELENNESENNESENNESENNESENNELENNESENNELENNESENADESENSKININIIVNGYNPEIVATATEVDGVSAINIEVKNYWFNYCTIL